MKHFFFAFLLATLVPAEAHARAESAPSSAQTSSWVKALKARHEKRQARATGAELFDSFLSPELPTAGDEVTVFLRPVTGYEDTDLVVEATFNGQPVVLEQPTPELWIFHAGRLTELKAHSLVASIFVVDRYRAGQIRDAIVGLESDIAALNEQIANATDPAEIAQLTLQRDAKVGQKNAIVQQLADLRAPLGQKTVEFSVKENTASPDFPRVLSVNPTVGPISGGTLLTITGLNFLSGSTVRLGGENALVQSLSPSSITVVSPSFASEGAKDLEVRHEAGGVVKNTFLKNAYFATAANMAPPQMPPVAVARSTSWSVSLGSPADFNSNGSYDPNGQAFTYSWRLVARPLGSALPLPTEPTGDQAGFTIMPDVPGYYVVEMKLKETTAPFHESEPVLAVVNVESPANRAPTGSAPAISVSKNFSRTSQVTTSDLDTWQQRTLLLTKQSAFGTATLSSTGLITFNAGPNAGSDTLELTVVDNGTPPLSTVISVPVTVLENQPPVITGPIYYKMKLAGVPYQARLSTFNSPAVADPDGSIAKIEWDFGDGTKERTLDQNFASILHNYMAPGTYTVTLKATDNLGAVSSLSHTIVVENTDVPTAKFTMSPLSGTFPLTVTFDASAASDSEGIVQYRWLFFGSPPEQVSSSPTITRTYNAPGSYTVRLRTLDAHGAEGEATVNFTLGNSPSVPTISQFAMPARIATLGNALSFYGGRSFDPAGGALASYDWLTADFLCPGGDCALSGQDVSYTYPQSRNYFASLATTRSGGGSGARTFVEVFNVNTGAPPRAIIRSGAVSGTAPFTLNVDGSESYDYDGTIANYKWTWQDGNVTEGPATASHVYTNPGVYGVLLEVTDNDGNITFNFLNITVNAAQAKSRRLDPPYDGEREAQRQLLTNACWSGEGSACSDLATMYDEDGDAFTAMKLRERACVLGHEPACLSKF